MEKLVIFSDNIQNKSFRTVPFVFLHGELERKAGYDLCKMENIRISEKTFRVFVNNKALLTGKYPCTVITDTGVFEQCTLFYWKGITFHGLIVLNTDKEAYDDAQLKFARREKFI
jgi:hypothetical protein